MIKFKLLWLALVGIFYIAQGQNFTISAKFKDGNVTFRWPATKNKNSDITIKLGNSTESAWKKSDYESYMYRVDNVLIYGSVRIKVRDDRSVMGYPEGYQDYNMTYTVSLVESKIGDSKNISWTLSYFPNAGSYNIYHLKAKLKKILAITFNGSTGSSKYIYYSRPYNSIYIAFGVNDIQLSDAGFYAGGTSTYDAGSMGGVVLVVHNKPTKPEIKGDLNIPINTLATLTCSSNSTSVPEYYSRIAVWKYSWFINNTIPVGGNTTIYRINVTKDVKYNSYSCQSFEHFKSIEEGPSDQSDPVRINPLYGPSRITITSLKFKQGKLTVREGEQIGQLKCTADCNPPCTLQWQYESLNGSIINAVSMGGTLEDQRAKRDMASFQCVAQWNDVTKTKVVQLNIQYISVPKFYLNGSRYNSNFLIREKDRLELSCHSEGKPTPNISVTRIPDLTMPGQSGNGWFNYTFQTMQCSNTGTYNCKGNSFETKETNITINVTCTLRIDNSEHFKSIYGSMSGPDVTLNVRVPVISTPPPSAQEISWTGPGTFITIKNQSVEQRENIIYKQWVLSTIPVKNKTYFGNYTMKYSGRDITTITINAEDKPQSPLDFSWNSYDVGFINLTWLSNFNGGPEQFFILSQKQGSDWIKVENQTDPGEGNMGYYDLGSLTPGQQYWYQLKSCNRINCSSGPKMLNFTVPALPTSSAQSEDNSMLIAIVSSAVGVVCIVIIAVVMTMYFLRKKSTQNHKSEERNSGSLETDFTQPDVVVYAAVDKSVLKKNRQQDDVVKSDVIKDQNVENDTVYSEVIKPSKRQKHTNKKNGQKNDEKKELIGKKEAAGGSNRDENTREVNEDGLVYIDVEFTNKGFESDKKGRPVVHGEEERTEYTFVDFSKKAPPMEEPQDDAE